MHWTFKVAKSNYFAGGRKSRTDRAGVKYRIGQVFVHKKHGYKGLIVGWDKDARAPSEWFEMNSVPLEDREGKLTPWGFVSPLFFPLGGGLSRSVERRQKRPDHRLDQGDAWRSFAILKFPVFYSPNLTQAKADRWQRVVTLPDKTLIATWTW